MRHVRRLQRGRFFRRQLEGQRGRGIVQLLQLGRADAADALQVGQRLRRARGDGSHDFSPTLDAHNRAVQKYQLRRGQ